MIGDRVFESTLGDRDRVSFGRPTLADGAGGLRRDTLEARDREPQWDSSLSPRGPFGTPPTLGF